jgi:phage head maturation protease
MDGLSASLRWAGRRGLCGGRDLKEIELREISLVSAPMLPGARFVATSEPIKIRVSCHS